MENNQPRHLYIRPTAGRQKRSGQDFARTRFVIQLLEPRKLLCGGGFQDGDLVAFQSNLISGLESFRTFGDNVDAFGDFAIEFSSMDADDQDHPATLGDAINLSDVVDQVFVSSINQFFNEGGTTASELVTFLSNLSIPDLNLTVECIEGGFTDDQSELRFDMKFQMTRDTEFEYSVEDIESFLDNADVQGFGGLLDIEGSGGVNATLSANASMHFSFGVELGSGNDNFFVREIEASQASAQLNVDLPDLTLKIGGDEFANLAGGKIAIDVQGQWSFLDPDQDGFLTVAEFDLSQYTLADITNFTTVGSFNALLPIGVTPPGMAGMNLGNGVVTARVDNFFADRTPIVSVDVDISEGFVGEVVLAGLEQLELLTSEFTSGNPDGDGLLDQAIPFLDKSINDLFNIRSLFALHTTADSYIDTTQAPTLHGLATILLEHLNDADLWNDTAGDATLADGPVRIRAGVSAETNQATFEFDLNLEREFRVDYLGDLSAEDLNDLLDNLPIAGFDDLFKLEVNVTDGAALIVSASLNANLAFGIDLVQVRDGADEDERAEAFYLSLDPNRPWFTIRSNARAQLPDFGLDLGNGQDVLFSGDVSGGFIAFDTAGEVFFRDLNDDGRLTFNELQAATAGSFEADLVSLATRGTLDGGFSLGTSLSGFENIGQAVVRANVQDIFQTPEGQYTFKEYLANLDKSVTVDFDLSSGGLNAAIEAGLAQLGTFFDGSEGSVTTSDVWSTALPLLDKTLAEILNLEVLGDLALEASAYLESPAFTRDLNDELFPTLHGLSDHLMTRIQERMAESSGSLEHREGPLRLHAGFAAERNELFFDLTFQPTNVFEYSFDLTQMIDLLKGEAVDTFGGTPLDLGGIAIGDSVDFRLETELALALSFGVDLAGLINEGTGVASSDFFFVAENEISPLIDLRAVATIGLPDLTITFGSYAGLAITDNMINLDITGSVALVDPSRDGRLTFDEISLIADSPDLKPSDFFTVNTKGALFGSFLLANDFQLAEFGAFDAASLVSYRVEDLFILNPVTQKPFEDIKLYLAALDKSVAIDFDISGNIGDILKLGLAELDGLFGTGVGDLGFFGIDFFDAKLPVINQSLGSLLGLNLGDSVWRNLGTQLAAEIDLYLNLPSFTADLTDNMFPTLRGLGDHLVAFFNQFGIPEGGADFGFGPLDFGFGFDATLGAPALDFDFGLDLDYFINSTFSMQDLKDLLVGVNIEGFEGFLDLPGLDPNATISLDLLGDLEFNLGFGIDLAELIGGNLLDASDFFLAFDPSLPFFEASIDATIALPTGNFKLNFADFGDLNVEQTIIEISGLGSVAFIDDQQAFTLAFDELQGISSSNISDYLEAVTAGDLSGSMLLSASLDGLGDLGRALVNFRLDDVFNNTVETTPVVTVDFDVSSGQIGAVIEAGLSQIASIQDLLNDGNSIINQTIPLIDKSLADLLNLDGVMKLDEVASQYINDAIFMANAGDLLFPTLRGLSTAIFEHLRTVNTDPSVAMQRGPVLIETGYDGQREEIFVNLLASFEETFDVTFGDGLDFETDVFKLIEDDLRDPLDLLGLTVTFPNGSSADLLLAAGVTLDLKTRVFIGDVIDGDDQTVIGNDDFYLQMNEFNAPLMSFHASAEAVLPDLHVELIDIFAGDVVGSTVSLEMLGNVNLEDFNNDGRITFAEFQATELSKLVAVEPLSRFNAHFELDDLTVGTFEFPSAIVSITSNDVLDMVANGTAPEIGIDVGLSEDMIRTYLLPGLNEFSELMAEFRNVEILNQALPLVERSVMEIIDFGGLLQFGDAAKSYLVNEDGTTNTDATARGLMERMTLTMQRQIGNLGDDGTGDGSSGPLSMYGGLIAEPGANLGKLQFNVDIDALITTQVELGLEAAAADIGIEMDSSAILDLIATMEMAFAFGVDLDKTEFYITLPDDPNRSKNGNHDLGPRFTMTVDSTDLDLSLQVGFIQAATQGGAASLAPVVVVPFNDIGNMDGVLTLTELENTTFSELVATPQFSGTASALLPIFAQVAEGAPILEGTITIPTFDLANFSADSQPEIQFQLDDLVDFSNLDARQVLNLMIQFGEFLQGFSDSPILSTTLPFTDGSNLGDVLDFGVAFGKKIESKLDIVNLASATSKRPDLVQLLNTDLTFQIGYNDNDLFDVTLRASDLADNHADSVDDLVIDLNNALRSAGVQAILEAVNQDGLLAFQAVNADKVDSIVVYWSSPVQSLMAELGFTEAHSIDLISRNLAPANGMLQDDLTFNLMINGAAIEIELLASWTDGTDPARQAANGSITDLVVDLQDAIDVVLDKTNWAGLVQVDQIGGRLKLRSPGDAVGTNGEKITTLSLQNGSDLGFDGTELSLSTIAGEEFSTPTFSTTQQLIDILVREAGLDPETVKVNYDANTHELVFDLTFEFAYTAFEKPIVFDLDLSPLAQIATDATIRLDGDATLAFQFGLQLFSNQELSLLSNTDVPADGDAGENVQFLLALDQGTSSESRSSAITLNTTGNETIDDLVEDLNLALANVFSGQTLVEAVNNGDGRIILRTINNDHRNLAIIANDGPGYQGDAPTIELIGFKDGHIAKVRAGEMFIDNASFNGNVALSFAGEGNFATASFPFLEIAAADGMGSVAGSAEFLLIDLQNNDNTRFFVSELLNSVIDGGNGVSISDIITPTVTIAAHGELQNLGVPGNTLGLDTLLAGLPGGRPSIMIDVADIYNNPNDIVVTIPDELTSFNNLDFLSIISALNSAVQYLADYDQFSFLNEPLPLIDLSVADLSDYANSFAIKVDEIAKNPTGAIQFLEAQIEQIFGLQEQQFR